MRFDRTQIGLTHLVNERDSVSPNITVDTETAHALILSLVVNVKWQWFSDTMRNHSCPRPTAPMINSLARKRNQRMYVDSIRNYFKTWLLVSAHWPVETCCVVTDRFSFSSWNCWIKLTNGSPRPICDAPLITFHYCYRKWSCTTEYDQLLWCQTPQQGLTCRKKTISRFKHKIQIGSLR